VPKIIITFLKVIEDYVAYIFRHGVLSKVTNTLHYMRDTVKLHCTSSALRISHQSMYFTHYSTMTMP